MRTNLSIACLVLASALGGAQAQQLDLDAQLQQRRELRATVEMRALEAAQQQVVAPDRLEVVSYRFGGSDPLTRGVLELDAIEVDGPNASGFVRVRFRMLVDGVPRGEARATVRGIVRGPAVVATRSLQRDDRVRLADLEVQEVDLTRVASPLRDPQEIAGMVPERTVGAGRTLEFAMFVDEPVVRRGDVVELVVERPGLVVTARGLVMADAAAGETVEVENAATGTRLLARARQDGTLLVLTRAASSTRARRR